MRQPRRRVRVPVWSTGVITTATRHDASAHWGYHRFFSTLWPLPRYNISAPTIVGVGVLTGVNTYVAAELLHSGRNRVSRIRIFFFCLFLDQQSRKYISGTLKRITSTNEINVRMESLNDRNYRADKKRRVICNNFLTC